MSDDIYRKKWEMCSRDTFLFHMVFFWMSYSECEVNFIRRACPIDHVCQCQTVEHRPNLVYDTIQIEVRVYIHDIYYPLIVLKLHRAIPTYELIVAPCLTVRRMRCLW